MDNPGRIIAESAPAAEATGERILVVEDDARMQRLLSSQLEARGFTVLVAGDGETALRLVTSERVHVVLLDIGLPGIDGLEVCKRIRGRSGVPIILVTAAERPETKMTALELGGDDYLTKPFHTGELIARIRAVLRRTRSASSAAPATGILDAGDLAVDLEKREVRRNGEVVKLTKMEFGLLHALASQPDRVVTYEDLLEAVWGQRFDDVRPVHVHMCHLRRKLETGPTGPRHIIAVPGVGYRFRVSG
jgi:two-component system KDP operon response regulator KdpE